MNTAAPRIDRLGLACALGCHAIWGSMPIYLMAVHSVPPVEFVAWRVLFTLPLCLVLVTMRRRWPELRDVVRDRRALLTLCASALLIGVNWFLYVWAIQTEHVYAASLGYYILPLVMMLLGLFVLGERLSRGQWAAVALAAVGVAALALGALSTLWVSLSLAISFGLYGLLRKTVQAGPIVGLTLETMILLPIAALLAGWYGVSPAGSALLQGKWVALAIMAGGPMTAAPLLLFATAARRLPYTLMGFIQFASPTIIFLLGLYVFGEDLRPAQLACFVAIWAAAALFSWELLRGAKARPVPA